VVAPDDEKNQCDGSHRSLEGLDCLGMFADKSATTG